MSRAHTGLSPPTTPRFTVPEPILIEFCERNVDRATRDWLEQLNSRPGVEVVPRGCMANCTRCFEAVYLRIDGRDIEGETHRAIVEEVLGADGAAFK